MEAARTIDAETRRDRVELHEETLAFVAATLRRKGCRIDRVEPAPTDRSPTRRPLERKARAMQRGRGPTVLRVTTPAGATLEVMVRAASMTVIVKRHRSPSYVYAYRYPAHKYNLHVHGLRRAHPDVWVLVPEESPGRAVVIPDAELGTTQVVEILAGGNRPATGRRRFEGRWDIVTEWAEGVRGGR